MIYDIVNPSDPYTIEADDLEVAAVACLILGSGQYAFRQIGTDEISVPFFFGGADDWTMEKFNCKVGDVVERVTTTKRAQLIECLESCLIGRASDRRDYDEALSLIDDPAKKQQFRDSRHDRRRSSMNDIGGRAYRIAEKLRAETPLGPADEAPRQVLVS